LQDKRGKILEFWAAAEVHAPAYSSLTTTRRLVEAFLNDALARSMLSSLKGKLRYVPIVMPDDMRENYPPRSKLLKKERIYECAPQLDYKTFVSGSPSDQLKEYLRGIMEAAPHLAGLGASSAQINELERILLEAGSKIPVESIYWPAPGTH
jgi:hypothetical protein